MRCFTWIALVSPILALCTAWHTRPASAGTKGDEGPAATPRILCSAAPRGIAPLLEAGALTVFGEMHGTAEAPAFVGDVVCHAVLTGREVLLGLEIPRRLAEKQIQGYLASRGGSKDVAQLLQSKFWRFEDGRSSRSMLALLDKARQLRQAGAKLRVFLFDDTFPNLRERDQRMAENILAEVKRSPQAISVVLVGNLHAKSDTERWMSWHLAKQRRGTRTLNVAYVGGSAWICLQEKSCGPISLSGIDRGPERFVELLPRPDAGGYSGRFYVGTITASLPGTSKLTAASLRAQGEKAYKEKDYKTCVASYLTGTAAAQGRRGGSDWYNIARCQALGGDGDRALASLQVAFATGFKDLRHAKAEPDLQTLRADPRWRTLVEAAEARIKAEDAKVHPGLARLFREDQADRSGDPGKIDWKLVESRDAERRRKVRAIVQAKGAKVSSDYYHAALVFQHGTGADVKTANEYAMKAVELDPENEAARWLVAASKDRYLMDMGKPQLYGTQFVMRNGSGKWELYKVDPSVTDEERAQWNAPPLAEARRRVEEMNKGR